MHGVTGILDDDLLFLERVFDEHVALIITVYLTSVGGLFAAIMIAGFDRNAKFTTALVVSIIASLVPVVLVYLLLLMYHLSIRFF